MLRLPLSPRTAAADDLALDVPDVASQLGLFVARAVVDDILPPAFIKTAEVRRWWKDPLTELIQSELPSELPV